MNSLPTIPLFPAGQIVATPGALALLEQANKSPLEFLSRHLRGDWGEELCPEEKNWKRIEPQEWISIAQQLSRQRNRNPLGDYGSRPVFDHPFAPCRILRSPRGC